MTRLDHSGRGARCRLVRQKWLTRTAEAVDLSCRVEVWPHAELEQRRPERGISTRDIGATLVTWKPRLATMAKTIHGSENTNHKAASAAIIAMLLRMAPLCQRVGVGGVSRCPE